MLGHPFLFLCVQHDILVKFGLNRIDPVEASVLLLDAEDLEQEGDTKGETIVANERILVVSVF